MMEPFTRSYRTRHQGTDLKYFKVQVKESDLDIGVDEGGFSPSLARDVEKQLIKIRGDLETYITLHPEFFASLEPVELLPGAPRVAQQMAEAAAAAGVGPMAAVAGTIAQAIGEFLDSQFDNIIVENGGDLFIRTTRERVVAVIGGKSPFSNRIAIKVAPEESPLGICTSSGTVGPSLSLGKADTALVKAYTGALADAVASGVGNRVRDKNNLMPALEYGQNINGVSGILVIMEDRLAAWGKIELVPLGDGPEK
ncbi:MAG: UPF0280 family protein [Chitinophagales bacterium]